MIAKPLVQDSIYMLLLTIARHHTHQVPTFLTMAMPIAPMAVVMAMLLMVTSSVAHYNHHAPPHALGLQHHAVAPTLREKRFVATGQIFYREGW